MNDRDWRPFPGVNLSLGLPTDDGNSVSSDIDSELQSMYDEVDSNASDYIRTLPFGNDPPDILHHGRAYSSDEDGDGPSKACITFKRLVRLIQSLCIVKADLPCHSDDNSSSSVGYANVPPRCDVCGTPCQVYRWCIYCHAGPVMHHGRCCWNNPGRPADKSHRAADDAPGRCAITILDGPAVQNKIMNAIQMSQSWEVIRLMGYTFDYQPLVAALCTAKAAAPDRRVDVVLDRAQTLTGPKQNEKGHGKAID